MGPQGLPTPQVPKHPLALPSSPCRSDRCCRLGSDSTGARGPEDPHGTDRGHFTFSTIPVPPASLLGTRTLVILCFSPVPLLSVLQWKVPTFSSSSSQSR